MLEFKGKALLDSCTFHLEKVHRKYCPPKTDSVFLREPATSDDDESFSWLEEMGVRDKVKKQDAISIKLYPFFAYRSVLLGKTLQQFLWYRFEF